MRTTSDGGVHAHYPMDRCGSRVALAACSVSENVTEPTAAFVIGGPAFSLTNSQCNGSSGITTLAFNFNNADKLRHPDGTVGRNAASATILTEGLNVAASGGMPCDLLNFSGTLDGTPHPVVRGQGKLGVGTDEWVGAGEQLTVSLGSALGSATATRATVNLRGHNQNTEALVQPLLDGNPVGAARRVPAGLTPDRCSGADCLGRAVEIRATTGERFNAIRVSPASSVGVSISGGSVWPGPAIRFEL